MALAKAGSVFCTVTDILAKPWVEVCTRHFCSGTCFATNISSIEGSIIQKNKILLQEINKISCFIKCTRAYSGLHSQHSNYESLRRFSKPRCNFSTYTEKARFLTQVLPQKFVPWTKVQQKNQSFMVMQNLGTKPSLLSVDEKTGPQFQQIKGNTGIQENISALQKKKRVQRKKKTTVEEDLQSELKENGPSKKLWHVVAYATSEEYDLEKLSSSLNEQGLYHPSSKSEDIHDILHVSARYQVDKEPREIYFFREGSTVFWNVPELEQQNVLKYLQDYEQDSYDSKLVLDESEMIIYSYTEVLNKTRLVNGRILLNAEGSVDLEKYTFSNAMALSVKLGIWEASLDRYADSIEHITEEMKHGKKMKISREQVLQKQGELFALRHLINLSSDLLDTPDFYWDRENLEALYHKTCNHLNITKRTRVMNEKLNHCCELVELVSSHLNEKHSTQLEWMIIILIAVEVFFEIIHFLERLF